MRNANDGQELEEVRRQTSGVDWQRDFFDQRLRDHQELEEKTGYILVNPVRKGLCEQAEDWVWIYRPNDRPPQLWG
jgi:REP element-mobilizing transposase RayT